jgi:NitT/TauT family transport system substrate-binding protein
MRKVSIQSVLIFILVCIAQVGFSNTQKATARESENQEPLVKMNIGYLPSPEHLLLYVAQEKGFFKANGIDSELFQFTNSAEGMNSIVAGKIDVGPFGVSAPLAFISKGADAVVIGGANSGACALVVMPDRYEELKDIKNYRGKKIASVRLSTADVIFRGALLDAGIDWKKDEAQMIELESPAATMEALKKGRVDAALIWTPYVAMAEDLGVKVAMYITDLYDNNVCCRQAVLRENLQEHPELWVNFMAALIQAYDFYQTNHEETIDIIAKYVRVDKKYLEKETYAEDATMICSPDPMKLSVNKYWGIMKQTGFIKSDIDINDHINVAMYKAALDRLLKEAPENQNYLKLAADFQLQD